MTSTRSERSRTTIVVGAGMAGVTAAAALEAAGRRVVVLDKGRRVGGRMATRRVGDATFDHGSQHFSIRTEPFRRSLQSHVDGGLVVEWFRSRSITQPERGVEVRHAVTRGMRRLPEALASGLQVVTAVTITDIVCDGGEIRVGDGVRWWSGDELVLTPPPPQAARLLVAAGIGGAPIDRLASTPYEPCLALLATLGGPAELVDGHLAPDDEIIGWIGDNRHKGVSAVDAVTVHATAEFSRRHLEEDPVVWAGRLRDAASRYLGSAVTSTVAHRWRFARPAEPTDEGAVVVAGAVPIVVAGEAFAGARVEGAFTSGRAAAALLLESAD